MKNLIDELILKNYKYKTTKNGLIITDENRHVYLDVDEIPPNTIFQNSGILNVRSATSLPTGTVFSNFGPVILAHVTKLPESTIFNNRYHVPETPVPGKSVHFNNIGSVDLPDLSILPEHVYFNNQAMLFLENVTEIPATAQFNNIGRIYFGPTLKIPRYSSKIYVGGQAYSRRETV